VGKVSGTVASEQRPPGGARVELRTVSEQPRGLRRGEQRAAVAAVKPDVHRLGGRGNAPRRSGVAIGAPRQAWQQGRAASQRRKPKGTSTGNEQLVQEGPRKGRTLANAAHGEKRQNERSCPGYTHRMQPLGSMFALRGACPAAWSSNSAAACMAICRLRVPVPRTDTHRYAHEGPIGRDET
jgi:hypothetical protein